MNNETKRDYPFPDTSSTPLTPVVDLSYLSNPVNLSPVTDGNVDWHKLIKVDPNPQPLGERDPELFPAELLKRIKNLEQENENMKVLLSLIFAITNRFKNKLFEPETWRVITEFAHKMGLQSIKFDMTDPVTYQIIDNK
jgi:hypothetical protein